MLWNGGITFGGVIAFIFADLTVIPILDIYRKYYGPKMAPFLFVTFYDAMAAAALIVEGVFGALGLIPKEHNAQVVEASVTWNYTTWAQSHFSSARSGSRVAVSEDRRAGNAAHDEQTC